MYLQPFPNREFDRETKNIILCWKHFTNNIYRVKKESINDKYNGLQGIGPSVRRSRSVYLQNLPNREFERENKKHLSLLETFYKLFYWSKKKESVNIYWITWYPIIGIVVLIIWFCFFGYM